MRKLIAILTLCSLSVAPVIAQTNVAPSRPTGTVADGSGTQPFQTSVQLVADGSGTLPLHG
jgi:hypothetical protein